MHDTWISAEKEFESFFQGKQNFVFHFHDSRAAMGVTGSKRVFTTSHPSDYLVTSHGVMFYAEVKESGNEPSFPFANVKKSQWAAAIQQVAAGGLYFFFIRRKSTGVWYKVPATVLIAVREIKSSIRWDEISLLEYRKPI